MESLKMNSDDYTKHPSNNQQAQHASYPKVARLLNNTLYSAKEESLRYKKSRVSISKSSIKYILSNVVKTYGVKTLIDFIFDSDKDNPFNYDTVFSCVSDYGFFSFDVVKFRWYFKLAYSEQITEGSCPFEAYKTAHQLTEGEAQYDLSLMICSVTDSLIPFIQIKPDTKDESPYPVEQLGSFLHQVEETINHYTQHPKAITSAALLTVISTINQMVANVVNADVSENITKHFMEKPLSLFFMTIADPAEGKSTSDKCASHPLREAIKHKVAEYEIRRKEYLKNLKKYEKATAKGESADHPIEPHNPDMIFNRGTVEGLLAMLSKCPNVLWSSAEGASFFDGYSFTDQTRKNSQSIMNELFDGDPVENARRVDPIGKLFNRRLTLHIMGQPRIMLSGMKKPEFQEQGFGSRCLISYPTSTLPNRNVDIEIDKLQDDPVYKEWCNFIKWYMDTAIEIAWEGYTLIKCSSEAREILKEIYKEMLAEIGDAGRYAHIKPFAARCLEHVLRLSANLAMIDFMYGEFREGHRILRETFISPAVTKEHVTRAYALYHYYLEEADRLSGHQNEEDETRYDIAFRGMKFLREKFSGKIVTLRDIHRFGPIELRKAPIEQIRLFLITPALRAHCILLTDDFDCFYVAANKEISD